MLHYTASPMGYKQAREVFGWVDSLLQRKTYQEASYGSFSLTANHNCEPCYDRRFIYFRLSFIKAQSASPIPT